MTVPTPAQAAVCFQPGGTAPITYLGINDFITCVNTETRMGDKGYAIELETDGDDHYIDLSNSGILTATDADTPGDVYGIFTETDGADSPIHIVNSGDIEASSDADRAFGIFARTDDTDSPIHIKNSGDI